MARRGLARAFWAFTRPARRLPGPAPASRRLPRMADYRGRGWRL